MRIARLLFLALAPCVWLLLSACGSAPMLSRAEGGCSEQIMLSLAPGVARTDRVIQDLQSRADVQLEYLRSASPTLFVYRLSARGKDPECVNALARLNQDSRVRFAESDTRRRHFDAVK